MNTAIHMSCSINLRATGCTTCAEDFDVEEALPINDYCVPFSCKAIVWHLLRLHFVFFSFLLETSVHWTFSFVAGFLLPPSKLKNDWARWGRSPHVESRISAQHWHVGQWILRSISSTTSVRCLLVLTTSAVYGHNPKRSEKVPQRRCDSFELTNSLGVEN